MMPDGIQKAETYRFDEMAVQVKDKVHPADADVDRYVGLEHIDPEALKIRRWGEPSDVESSKILFKSGDIIFGKRRAYLRKLAVADFDGICSAHAMVLRAKADVVLEEFLPFFMQSDVFMQRAVQISVGGLSPTINWKDLAKEEFLLPTIEQQRKLLPLLTTASRNLEILRTLAESVSVVGRSTSAQLFSRVVSPAAFQGLKLGDLFTHVVDRGHEGLPILSVTIDGAIVRRDSLGRNVSDDTGDQKYLRVLPGDIAYNTMRLWQGAVGVAREEGLVSPAYTVLRQKGDEFESEFLLEMFRSPAMQRQYRRFVTGVASDRWRLYFKDLSRIQIVLPDGDSANRIMLALKRVRQAESEAADRVSEALRLMQSLRQRTFQG